MQGLGEDLIWNSPLNFWQKVKGKQAKVPLFNQIKCLGSASTFPTFVSLLS